MLPSQPEGSNELAQRPRKFFPRTFLKCWGERVPVSLGILENSCFKAPGFVETECSGISWIVIDQIDSLPTDDDQQRKLCTNLPQPRNSDEFLMTAKTTPDEPASTFA